MQRTLTVSYLSEVLRELAFVAQIKLDELAGRRMSFSGGKQSA